MPRHVAFQCLRSGSEKPLTLVDHYAAERGLDPRDTALARHLVGVEIRRRATLRAVVAGFAHQKPKPELATLLRLGIAQILFLDRVPDHAAISETVRATTDFLGLSKGGIVNGVLRSVQRSLRPGRSGDPTADLVDRDFHFDGPVFRHPDEHPHLWAEDALSIPAPLHKRWAKRYGLEPANALGRLALEEAPLSIRFAGDPAPALEELRAADVTLAPTSHDHIRLCAAAHTGAVIESQSFKGGNITIQGEHALRAAELCGDTAGRQVLDVCAAPGGKTAVLASGSPKRHVSLDLSPKRLASVRAIERLGVPVPELASMDGTASLHPDARFDVVLLDAPCSNTGVLAQRPSARWRYGPKNQKALTELQARLIDDCAERVAPGGAFVYSTCSIESEENEGQITRFLDGRSGWSREESVESLPASFDQGGPIDGGFAVRLRRLKDGSSNA